MHSAEQHSFYQNPGIIIAERMGLAPPRRVRKPRRQPLPAHERNYLLRDIKSAFHQLFHECAVHKWTLDTLLTKRGKLLEGKRTIGGQAPGHGAEIRPEQFARLSELDKTELSGYWEGLNDSFMRTLEIRCLIKGKWYSIDESPTAMRLREGENNCHYVHTTTKGDEYSIYF